MKFSVSKEVIQMVEVLERSPHVRRIVWGAMILIIIWRLPEIITVLAHLK